MKHLKDTTSYKYDKPDAAMLDTFESPFTGKDARYRTNIEIKAPEFTSLCPITGQPDFATIIINYTPHKLCVESKSLKLYLGSFRMHGEFHEACVQRIADDFIRMLDPIYLRVEGQFAPRGGIPFWPSVLYYREDDA